MGNMVGMGITNLVGVGLIGATAGVVGGMPAGTAKDIAGIVPGLQSVALVGGNLGMLNNQFKINKPRKKRR